ncbi:MAG: flippase [Candidatus Nanoarchaeia archaeon]|nr:flippase [Candidatus Nanoarchaeia archaeon]
MKKFGHKSILIFILTFLAGLFGYLTRMIYARNLSIEQYGLFYAVFSLVFFFGPFRDLGLSEATLYHLNKKDNEKKTKSILIYELIPQLIFGLIFFIIFFSLRNYIATSYFKDPLALQIMNFLLPLFIIETIALTLSSFLNSKQQFVLFNFQTFLSGFLRFSLAFLGFRIFKDISNVPAITYFISQVILIIFLASYFIYKYNYVLKQKFHYEEKLFKSMFSYALPVMFSTASTVILTYSDTILLTFFKGANSVAQYNVAYPSLNIILIFASAFIGMIFPIISKLYHNRNHNKITELINTLYNNFLIFTLPLGLIFFSYPKLIVNLLFGEQYLPAAIALQIFALSFIFIVLRDINFGVIAGIGKVRQRSKIMYIGAFSNIILDLILIPFFDIAGAAIATSMGFLLMAILTARLIKKEYEINIQKSRIIKIILSNLFFFISIIMLKKLLVFNWIIEAILVLLISAIIYLISLFIFKVLTIEYLKDLWKKYF